MAQPLTSVQVWEELKKEVFAVLGMVTSKGEARTVGVVYIVHDRKIYISTRKEAWKARHVRGNPHVSITVPIAKRIPILPWIKIPAATITFCGEGTVHGPKSVSEDILPALLRGGETDSEMLETICVIEIVPVGEFITYGLRIPLMEMRDPQKARGRVPVV